MKIPKKFVIYIGGLLITAIGFVYLFLAQDSHIIFSRDVFVYQNKNVPFSGRRLVYIHGLRGSHHDLLQIPAYNKLIQDLTDSGWQVVMFDLPLAQKEYFSDGGIVYRLAYLAKLQQAVQYADDHHGAAKQTVIGGISFGALHALVGCGEYSECSGFFAILPVVRIGALDEFKGMSVPQFDPQVEIYPLSRHPGFIAWNTTDQRVNYQYTIDLVSQLKQLHAPISTHVYNQGGHSIVGNLDDLASWLNSTFLASATK